MFWKKGSPQHGMDKTRVPHSEVEDPNTWQSTHSKSWKVEIQLFNISWDHKKMSAKNKKIETSGNWRTLSYYSKAKVIWQTRKRSCGVDSIHRWVIGWLRTCIWEKLPKDGSNIQKSGPPLIFFIFCFQGARLFLNPQKWQG